MKTATATTTTKKTGAKATTTKGAGKPSANGHTGAATKKDGLRKPQIRILKALAKAKGQLSRKEISELAPVDLAFCVEYIGSSDPEVRAKNDAKSGLSLITRKFVKADEVTEEGKGKYTVYDITAAGKAALAKIQD